MSIIKSEWIKEFFADNEDFYFRDDHDNSLYIDGFLSPGALANFLNRQLASEIREPGADWQPTAENINSLPKGMKDYICALETNADPQWVIRENILMKDLIRQLEAKIEQGPKVTREEVHKFCERGDELEQIEEELAEWFKNLGVLK